MFQTDSDEDVVFVFERCAHKPTEITIDQSKHNKKKTRGADLQCITKAKRLALQRDIDQQSQPKEPAKPLSTKRLVAEERQAEMVKMKMEEEKSEEKPIKKEKKHKKGQANEGSQAEVKKEPKKGKMADAVVTEERSWDGSGEKGEQKKKKKKSDSLNVANGSEVTDGKGVNKKKKKLLADTETQVEIAESLVKEEQVEKKQKKKKANNKSTQMKQENIVKEEEEEQQVGEDNLPKKVKKRKKHILDMSTEVTKEQMKEKKKLLADDETQLETAQSLVKEEDVEKKQKKKVKDKSTQIKRENLIKKAEDEQKAGKANPTKKVKEKKHILDVSTEVTEEQIKEKKKKQKCPLTVGGGTVTTTKKGKVAENGIKLETPEYENEDVKRRKKKNKTKEDGNGEETPEIKGKTKKSKAVSDKDVKSEKQEKSTDADIVHMDEGKTELKKKEKKAKCKISTVEVAKIEEEEPKKKKRKKVNHEEDPLLDKSEEVQEDEQRRENLCKADDTPKKKSKKKKSSAQVEHVSEVGVEPVAKKKKKIKQEQEDPEGFPQVDVVFLSERSGNTDETTINQERRQALQMEIDKASQPQKPVKPTGFGQWSTAQFNSSEQQQKFLRLMGGFKKGFQPAATNTGGANMALGKDGQQQLQQSLLGEFERAQSRRMDFNNRGAGLGFTAPSNKKFSIDINACRSVRFDD